MAAAAFFYAGTLGIQWQLLIVIIFLFFGTLAFFTVIFDEPLSEETAPLVRAVVFKEDEDNDGYPNDTSANA
jgi:hypothetical protein